MKIARDVFFLYSRVPGISVLYCARNIGALEQMNCLYEAVASVYMRVRGRFVPVLNDDIGDAEENLESCRASLASKERDIALQASALGRAAIAKRKAGDLAGARFHLQVLFFGGFATLRDTHTHTHIHTQRTRFEFVCLVCYAI
jgi:hypothetical protein